jgi:hypothetical protein
MINPVNYENNDNIIRLIINAFLILYLSKT